MINEILIQFKSGHQLELNEKILGCDTLTVHGHFLEMLKIHSNLSIPNKEYKAERVLIELNDIDFILYQKD